MKRARRFQFFIVVDAAGGLDAWASDAPVDRELGAARLHQELIRHGNYGRIAGAGEHEEAPPEWITLRVDHDEDLVPSATAIGLASDEDSARAAAKRILSLGGEAAALRLRRFSVSPPRIDLGQARPLLRRSKRFCRHCGLRRRGGTHGRHCRETS